MEPQLTLYYLPFRARAEPIRMILHCGGIPFNDVTIALEEWKTIKSHGEIAPNGQLPSMRLADGTVIAQSGSIVRYVAKLTGIYPMDPIQAAKADMIYEFAQELNMISPLLNFWVVSTDTWKSNYQSFFQTLPQHFAAAEHMLQGPFFNGYTPHHGDFAFFHVLDCCITMQAHCLDQFPRLQDFMGNMLNMPALHAYMVNRLPPKRLGMFCSFMQAELSSMYGKLCFGES